MNDQKPQKIVTRFAPSPTGLLHAGTYRTALFNYLFAKQHDGKIILRIEDTDTARSKKEYEENILESLAWIGLTCDETYKQSERSDIYRKYLKKLVDEGKAYISKETIEKEGDRAEVIRFKNPGKKITFTDLIRGEVTFDTTELGDFVIAKSFEEPVYHLAVVVDDFEMEITHIIRGEDHVSNTPRHILIQEAIGAPRPIYAHLPLVLGPDRAKLSKRKGALALSEYRNRGYLPAALINYMAFIGWNPGTEQEIFTLNELIRAFDITKIQKGGAIFDGEKLRWMNKEHLKKMPVHEFYSEIKKRITGSEKYKTRGWQLSDNTLEKITPLVVEKIEVFSDIGDIIEKGELDYIFETPTYEKESLLWKKEPDVVAAKRHLEFTLATLSTLPEESFVTPDGVKASLWNYAEKEGRGNVLWPLRYALSGKEKSPDPFVLAMTLGKTETIIRLKIGIEKLGQA